LRLPIDAIVLSNLAAADDVVSEHKRAWAKDKWTKLNDKRYYELINELRQAVRPDEPFWKLERFWPVSDDSGL
jgi:hypothetical protein